MPKSSSFYQLLNVEPPFGYGSKHKDNTIIPNSYETKALQTLHRHNDNPFKSFHEVFDYMSVLFHNGRICRK